MQTMEYRGKRLVFGDRTQIMGILNITPDSFSDGGQYDRIHAAVERAKEMLEQGADIIDIGGESTRPDAERVSLEEELRRVIPVVEALARETNAILSVDTYKAEVARQALEAGAHIINDVWGFKEDPNMAQVAAAYGCPVILMHNRRKTGYSRFFAGVVEELLESVRIAREAGVADDKIILDPGIGFAKNHEQNLYLLSRLQDLAALGYPLLLGTSRKRVIRNTLELPTNDVVEGTVATTVLGIFQGCSIIRVHDVLENKRAAVMTDAILQSKLS